MLKLTEKLRKVAVTLSLGYQKNFSNYKCLAKEAQYRINQTFIAAKKIHSYRTVKQRDRKIQEPQLGIFSLLVLPFLIGGLENLMDVLLSQDQSIHELRNVLTKILELASAVPEQFFTVPFQWPFCSHISVVFSIGK